MTSRRSIGEGLEERSDLAKWAAVRSIRPVRPQAQNEIRALAPGNFPLPIVLRLIGPFHIAVVGKVEPVVLGSSQNTAAQRQHPPLMQVQPFQPPL